MAPGVEASAEHEFDWLEDFLAEVRSDGILVDIAQRLTIYRLCAQLAGKWNDAGGAERCGRLLIPILAGSPAQQAACESALRRVFARRGHEPPPPPSDHSAEDRPNEPSPWVARLGLARLLVAGTLAIAFATAMYFVAAVYGPRLLSRQVAGDIPRPQSDSYILSAEEGWKQWLDTYPIDKLEAPRQSPFNRTLRWWYTEYDATKWAATSIPALLYIVLLSWLFYRLIAYLRRQALSQNLHSLEWPLSEPGARFGDRRLVGELQPLRKLARSHVSVLDPDRSALASSESAGLLKPQFRQVRVPVDFIALIDRRSPRDHLVEFQMQIVRTLRDAGLSVEVFEYDQLPGLCRSTRTGQVLRLQALADRVADSVILMFANASELLDPARHRLIPAVVSLASAWRAVLVTPEGDIAETALESHLAGELGISIVRSTPSGMRDMVAKLTSLSITQRSNIAPVRRAPPDAPSADDLEEFLSERPTRWMQQVPPHARDRRRLVELLRTTLGSAGVRLLAATSVYPELRWRMTVGIKAADGGGVRSRMLDDELLAVSRLPWMRRGWMPDWTRRLLQQLLTREERERVHGVVVDALLGAKRKQDSDAERLSVHLKEGSLPRDPVRIDRVTLDFLLPALQSVKGLFVLPRGWAARVARARLRKVLGVATAGFAVALATWFVTLALLPIDECDLLAASVVDNQAVGPPNHDKLLQIYYANDAVRACTAATQRVPSNGRYWYQLARAWNGLDKGRAHLLAMKAASLNYPAAHNFLGVDYLDGDGVGVDFVASRRHLTTAIELGNTASRLNLGHLEQREGNAKRAFQVLRQYVGDGGALTIDLANYYKKGVDEIVAKDLNEYRRLLKLGVARHGGTAAAELAWATANGVFDANIDWHAVEDLYWRSLKQWDGDAWPARNLARIYRDGRPGIPKDLRKATYLYMFAAKLRDAEADAALTGLVLSGGAVFEKGYEPPIAGIYSCVQMRASPKKTDVYRLSSASGGPGHVSVHGNGRTDLDLSIRDSKGASICRESGPTDQELCRWELKGPAEFEVRVENLDDAENDYRLCVNAATTIIPQ